MGRRRSSRRREEWTRPSGPSGRLGARVSPERPREEFLAGAAIPFTLVFKVPASPAWKDLVFTAIRYDFRAGFDQKKVRPTDIRVHLEP